MRRKQARAAVDLHVPLHLLIGLLWIGAAAGCGPSPPSGPAASRETAQLETTRKAPASSSAAPDHSLPKIDVHLHVDLRSVNEALSILNEHRIVIGLNASGGEAGGGGLELSQQVAIESKGRLQPLCNLRLSALEAPDFAAFVTQSLEGCKALGGKGLKVAKVLGLGVIDRAGVLVPVDDPRLDIVFDTAGRLGLPVLIHSGDPKAFFEPPTPSNERFEELRVHPGWSFHGTAPNGQPWPSWETLLQQHERRVARHPKTTFVGAHFGNAAEDPDRVARMLDRYPNYVIDTAARVPEFGRHAATRMRAFFAAYQDRILFGSDLGVGPDGLTLGSGGERPGTRAESREFFERHFLYFETSLARMQHPTPIQGSWTVDGIGLSHDILKKLYATNAARVFNLTLND